MPQMAPLMWMLLFFYFLLMLLILKNTLFFQKMPSSSISQTMTSKLSLNKIWKL